MTGDEFVRALADQLHHTAGGSLDAQLVLATVAASDGPLDRYDAVELLAKWVAEALDPGGTGELATATIADVVDAQRGRRQPLFRLHGIEAAVARHVRGLVDG